MCVVDEMLPSNSNTHSNAWGPQFSTACRILSRATEFASCRGISMFSWNSVLASNKGTNTAHFGRFQVAILYVYMISP